jgi:hypothetical protein
LAGTNAIAGGNQDANISPRSVIEDSLHRLTAAYTCRDIYGPGLYPLVREEAKSKLETIGASSEAIAGLFENLEKVLQSTDAIGKVDFDECLKGIVRGF